MAGPPASESESEVGSGCRFAQSVRAANNRSVDDMGASLVVGNEASDSAIGETCSDVGFVGIRVTEMVDSGSWSSYDWISLRI